MSTSALPQSPTNATYVDPSAEAMLKPGLKLGDLLRRNMTQQYVLQRLTQRAWWVQSFNYGTVFYVGERGVLIFDTLEGVYDNIATAVASNLKQVYGLDWDYLSGSHGNIGARADIDFHLAFIADMKAAVGKAMGEHPFAEFVNPQATAHTEFLANFFANIASEATSTLRPKYGRMYGFEEATPPNAEMVAWAMFEYR